MVAIGSPILLSLDGREQIFARQSSTCCGTTDTNVIAVFHPILSCSRVLPQARGRPSLPINSTWDVSPAELCNITDTYATYGLCDEWFAMDRIPESVSKLIKTREAATNLVASPVETVLLRRKFIQGNRSRSSWPFASARYCWLMIGLHGAESRIHAESESAMWHPRQPHPSRLKLLGHSGAMTEVFLKLAPFVCFEPPDMCWAEADLMAMILDRRQSEIRGHRCTDTIRIDHSSWYMYLLVGTYDTAVVDVHLAYLPHIDWSIQILAVHP